MRFPLVTVGLCLLLSCLGLQNGQGADRPPAVITWTQWCECGVPHTYAYTFDDKDYEVIADLAAGFHVPAHVFYEGPEGPSPAASSSFAKDLSFGSLRGDLPGLGKDTFRSFLRRNDPIPAHRVSAWHSPRSGKTVTVFKPGEKHQPDDFCLSRAGFSRDGRQALIYDDGGAMFLLSRGGDGVWHVVKQTSLWIS